MEFKFTRRIYFFTQPKSRDEEIRAFAGHKVIATTQQSYFFATDTLDTRMEAYEQAISRKMS